MNTTLTASAVFCAALISGCSSAPALPEPTGEWEDFHQAPFSSPPASVSTPTPKSMDIASAPTSASTAIKATATMVLNKSAQSPAVAPLLPSSRQTKPLEPKASISAPAPARAAKSVDITPSKPIALTSPISIQVPPKVIVSAPEPPMVIANLVPPPKPLPEPWVVSANDATLRRALNKWVQRAGWQLVWDASVDVPISVTANFTGDFNAAVKKLFQSLSAADVNLSAVLYSGNRVLRVTESGRRAQ